MADTVTLGCWAGSTVTVTAHPTAAPGLVVHAGPFGDDWRLTHEQTGRALGEFDVYDDAKNAAIALAETADWTAGPETFQTETVISQVIDAVEGAGGLFLSRKGGLGEQVAAKRVAHLAGQGSAA